MVFRSWPRSPGVLVLAGVASGFLVAAASASGQASAPDPLPGRTVVVITAAAARTSTSPEENGFDVRTLERAALERAPALRLDDVLREQAPGFGLFRRNSSRVANPTTQGVSLRNVGPNGAGRTLVLLDGVPQNDPFGGWVYWSRLPVAGVERVEIQQGGGAGLFGNAALGGTVTLFSRALPTGGARDGGAALAVEAQGGSANTYEVSAAGQRNVGPVAFFARASRFSSDGYPTVREDQGGPVDVDVFSRADLAEIGARWAMDDANTLSLKASGFRERRGGGTPGTNNSSEAADLSGTLEGELPPVRGEVIGYALAAYGQWRDYANTFSAVNADRTAETPSLDQSSVPARAAGGSALAGFTLGENAAHRLLLGTDARTVDGETRERFRFLPGQGFTRTRRAGGEQLFVGAFAEDAWRLDARTTLTAAGRLDVYRLRDGRRRETDAATGAVTRSERFPNRDDLLPNGRLGLSHRLRPEDGPVPTRLRTGVYTGFREPTLNELFRPFRVRNDLTEPNPALRAERLLGGDLGAVVQPVAALRVTVGGFWNELWDPVANVTLAQGPANVAPFGVIPEGGVGRQRQNLGRARVFGAEAGAAWEIGGGLALRADYLWSRGRIVEAQGPQRTLRGKRLAQAPEHTFTAGAGWAPAFLPRLRADASLRAVGEQFEDDLNALPLAAFVTVDAALSCELAPGWQARVSVENLLDAEIQAGRTADGLVSVGTPRLVNVGLRWTP